MPVLLPLERDEAVEFHRSERSQHCVKWKLALARENIRRAALRIPNEVFQVSVTDAG